MYYRKVTILSYLSANISYVYACISACTCLTIKRKRVYEEYKERRIQTAIRKEWLKREERKTERTSIVTQKRLGVYSIQTLIGIDI